MLSPKALALMALALGLVPLKDSAAQEFRIYTKVYDAAAAQNLRPTVIGGSLSLFHAGKVYDHVENQNESEVIIFEPVHQRFTILSTSRSLATTVHFDEIKHKLKLAKGVTEQHLQSLLAQNPPAAKETVEKVQFPIDPSFKTTVGPEGTSLRCESDHLTYRVRLADVEEPKTSEVYLNYADWMARLNYVLHPHALYPESRLALNGALRSTGKMPVEVELISDIGMPIHLRAEHQIHWKLDATDRSLIHEWEKLLKSDQTRHVTFQEYQRSVLVSRKD
jgi:hypothetical protein